MGRPVVDPIPPMQMSRPGAAGPKLKISGGMSNAFPPNVMLTTVVELQGTRHST